MADPVATTVGNLFVPIVSSIHLFLLSAGLELLRPSDTFSLWSSVGLFRLGPIFNCIY